MKKDTLNLLEKLEVVTLATGLLLGMIVCWVIVAFYEKSIGPVLLEFIHAIAFFFMSEKMFELSKELKTLLKEEND